MIKTVALLSLLLWCQPIIGQRAGSFDPKHYIEEKYYLDAGKTIYEFGVTTIELSNETIGASRFLKIKTESGALFIEKPGPSFLDSDGKNILIDCNGELEPAEFTKEQQLKLQYFVTEKISVDAGFVGNLIINQCNGSIMAYRVIAHPFEIGVSIKGQKNKSYRIFNQGLRPNIGFQMDF